MKKSTFQTKAVLMSLFIAFSVFTGIFIVIFANIERERTETAILTMAAENQAWAAEESERRMALLISGTPLYEEPYESPILPEETEP